MKKFFAFVAAALVAFSFASCNGNNPESKGFKIEISEITATTATVTVTPVDSTATYYWGVAETAQIAKLSDDSIQANALEMIEYYIALYEAFTGETYTVEDFLYKGSNQYVFESLAANTEYTVFAFKMDARGVAQGGVAKKNFKTPDVVVTGEVDLGVLEGTGFEDYRSDDGSYLAYATDMENYDVTLNIYDEDFVGDFTEADLDAEYSYIWTKEMNSEYGLAIVKAELKSELAGTDAATISGWAVATNGIKYKFSFTHPTEELTAGAPKKAARAAKAVPAFNKHVLLKK